MRMMRVGENSNSEDSMRYIDNDCGDFDDDERSVMLCEETTVVVCCTDGILIESGDECSECR